MARPDKRQRERARQQRRAARRATEQAESAAGQSGADPIRGTASSFIDPDLRWHMVRTTARLGPTGRRALDEAFRKGEVRAIRPRASEVVVRRGRRVVHHVPLLIRTVIVGVRDQDHLDRVAALPGIEEVVTYAPVEAESEGNAAAVVRNVARLDPEGLQQFVDALASGEIVRPVGVEVGSNVVVMDNRFYGFPGIVEKILPGDRIKVAVSIFGSATPVELGIADVSRA